MMRAFTFNGKLIGRDSSTCYGHDIPVPPYAKRMSGPSTQTQWTYDPMEPIVVVYGGDGIADIQVINRVSYSDRDGNFLYAKYNMLDGTNYLGMSCTLDPDTHTITISSDRLLDSGPSYADYDDGYTCSIDVVATTESGETVTFPLYLRVYVQNSWTLIAIYSEYESYQFTNKKTSSTIPFKQYACCPEKYGIKRNYSLRAYPDTGYHTINVSTNLTVDKIYASRCYRITFSSTEHTWGDEFVKLKMLTDEGYNVTYLVGYRDKIYRSGTVYVSEDHGPDIPPTV